jgi:hypothetical protein
MSYKVREATITFKVEKLNDAGQVEGVGDVPIQAMEAQFDNVNLVDLSAKVIGQLEQQQADAAGQQPPAPDEE